MAKKKGPRQLIKLRSTESSYIYYSQKNRRNSAARLELSKYDPVARRHVAFKETR